MMGGMSLSCLGQPLVMDCNQLFHLAASQERPKNCLASPQQPAGMGEFIELGKKKKNLCTLF